MKLSVAESWLEIEYTSKGYKKYEEISKSDASAQH